MTLLFQDEFACAACGGLVAGTTKVYGFAGKYCRCAIPQRPFFPRSAPKGLFIMERQPKNVIVSIARVAHEVNRQYCAALGDHSQLPWDQCPDWQKQSAINGVQFHVDNPDAGPKASHESWLEEKRRDGWKYGAFKDPANKLHPCFVPYEELPQEQRAKDFIFVGVVRGIMHEMARGPN